VFSAGLRVVANLVVAHLGGNDLLEHREGSAETAAFVRPGWMDELDAFDLGEQIHRLGKKGLMQLGGRRMLEPAQGPATVVQPDAMGELRPGNASTFRMSCKNSTSS